MNRFNNKAKGWKQKIKMESKDRKTKPKRTTRQPLILGSRTETNDFRPCLVQRHTHGQLDADSTTRMPMKPWSTNKPKEIDTNKNNQARLITTLSTPKRSDIGEKKEYTCGVLFIATLSNMKIRHRMAYIALGIS